MDLDGCGNFGVKAGGEVGQLVVEGRVAQLLRYTSKHACVEGVYVYVSVCMCMCMWECVCACMYTYVCISVCVYVLVCVFAQ